MNTLSKEQFLARKRSDRLAIMGSGYSINDITPRQWDIIDHKYDTIGMNWYCHSDRLTTWYLVREQANRKFREFERHTLGDFMERMAVFGSSCKIVKKVPYEVGTYSYVDNHDVLSGDGYFFNEISGACGTKSFRDNIFDVGIHHGRCTIYDVLHFAIQMDYKEILFCGVDLYDSRCFYMGYDEILPIVRDEGRSIDSPHKTAENTLSIVKKTAMTWPVTMKVCNKKSMLNTVIPVWEEA